MNEVSFDLFIINDRIATHGLEAQWGSGLTDDMIPQPDANNSIDGFIVLDVRERMLDCPNPLSVYTKLIDEGIRLIHSHGKVVICCSAGVSRSNSIAVGVLIKEFGMGFQQACALIKTKVPIADPLPCHLKQIRKLG